MPHTKYSDILNIHKKDQTTKESVELGDFTIDFGKNDAVIGIEIEHVSKFFSNLGIDPDSLSRLQEAKLVIDKRNPKYQLVFLELKLPTVIKKIPIPLTVAS